MKKILLSILVLAFLCASVSCKKKCDCTEFSYLTGKTTKVEETVKNNEKCRSLNEDGETSAIECKDKK